MLPRLIVTAAAAAACAYAYTEHRREFRRADVRRRENFGRGALPVCAGDEYTRCCEAAIDSSTWSTDQWTNGFCNTKGCYGKTIGVRKGHVWVREPAPWMVWPSDWLDPWVRVPSGIRFNFYDSVEIKNGHGASAEANGIWNNTAQKWIGCVGSQKDSSQTQGNEDISCMDGTNHGRPKRTTTSQPGPIAKMPQGTISSSSQVGQANLTFHLNAGETFIVSPSGVGEDQYENIMIFVDDVLVQSLPCSCIDRPSLTVTLIGDGFICTTVPF